MLKDVVNCEAGLAAAFVKMPAAKAQSQGFDKFMADMEKRSRDTAPELKERSDDRSRLPQVTRESSPRETQVWERYEAYPAADTEQSPELEEAEVVEDTAVEKESYEALEVVIVEYIAEAVQIPPVVVFELLAVTELEPEELGEPQAANKFLQYLLKVESPAELLTIPEYQESLKQLSEAVKEIAVTEAPPAEPKLALERLAGLVAELDEENRLVITEAEEEAEPFKVAARDEGSASRGSEENAEVSRFYEAAPIVQEAPEVMLQEAQPVEVTTAANPTTIETQAAAVQSAAQAAAASSAVPSQIMQQIVAHVKTIAPENFSELRLTLRPESLGDVSMRIAVQNGVVMALFVAESLRIKEIIESNFNQLRDALEEQGIAVSELFVSVNGDENAEEQLNQFLKARQEALRRLQRAAGLVSDVEEEEQAPIDPAIVLNNTVDFSA